MTTETITTRSMKAAQAIVAERGLTPDQFGIVKLATAKYELTITEKSMPEKLLEMSNGITAALATPAPVAARPAKAQKIDRHWNDDGSLTVYVHGRKVRRFGGEDNEEASEAEMEDVEAFVETWLNRKFPKKSGGWRYGRTTQGHNWHTKRAKMLRLRAEAEAAAAAAK